VTLLFLLIANVCAPCHPAIVKQYESTGMARSSGKLTGAAMAATVQDPSSGATYRINHDHRMEFERGPVKGSRLLEWFIGSGNVGKSFLFGMDGHLFQAPVSYYSAAAKWDVSPGFEGKRTIQLTRAVEPGCLQCHASAAQPEGGVSCERCHGPGQKHVVSGKAADIVQPAKLSAERRDGVCAQCHLTGVARVATANRKAGTFRAGDLLSDHLAVFVWDAAEAGELSATSHYERLAASKCKQASGDKLWCGSCHDSHREPAAAEKAGFYRQRCQSCHAQKPCTKAAATSDCASCHMPKGATRSVDHVAFTDHSIPRKPRTASAAETRRALRSFLPAPAGERETALGYAVAAMTEPAVRRQAYELLLKAPRDVAIMAQLAQFHDRMGQEEQAMALCEQIVAIEPDHPAAAVNLAIYRIKRGRTAEAIALWEAALKRSPAMTGARMNLAVALSRSGEREKAIAALRQALRFEPDFEPAIRLLRELGATP
jgi:tetratricopeptide (TPR) repeat protein